jgi:NADH-quinone oxidoreductase subunit M
MNGVPWISMLGGIAVVGSAVLALLPRDRPFLAKVTALGFSLLVLAGAIAMGAGYRDRGPRFQFSQSYTWIGGFGAHYATGVDGIAVVLVALTAVLVPVVVLASWREAEAGAHSVRTFFALILGTEALLIGAFGATDLFLFYVMFEAMLVPMYFLIGDYGGPRRSYAAVKFLLYSLAGGLLMLAAVIGMYVATLHHLPHPSFLFGAVAHAGHLLSPGIQDWLFLGFFIAFAIKAPLWPLHTWLPDAAAESPTGVAVLLVGVMDKVGTFGFLRWCLPLFPHASRVFAPYILGLCVAGILYGALLAIGQRDLKRLVAYSSVAHFGFIGLGIFAFTLQSQSGATLYMVNHGFTTGALFLIVGFLATRRGGRLMDQFGGVAKVAPWLAGAFLVAGLSALALPGLNGFVSEFLVLVGTFTSHRWFAVVAVLGIVLAALYILIMYQRTMHGPVRPGVEGFPDLSRREAWVIGPVLVIVVFLGVYPKPVLDAINPAVRATMAQLGAPNPRPQVPERSAISPANPLSLSTPMPGGGR